MSAHPEFSVTGRVACVTGGSSGLGQAMAAALADAGAWVVTVSRGQAEWVDGTRSVSVQADVSELDHLPALATAVAEPFGPPDILINAAGINTRQKADDVTSDGWQKTIDLNLSAPFFLAQALAPAMKEKGWGRIVNIASLQSSRAFPGGIAYGATKGGISQLTRAMAEAWSPHGINANALAPGFFPTALTGPVFSDPELSARHAAQTCIGRNGTMDDIVGPALFLCSEASAYVTGQVLHVDGGFTAK
ncbi:SDR family NAD(P)-dependent oxidoreductase [Pontivivens insulae]|uniref:Gluconate 5-dehydrogenase n=1 Tax=Pontivivens insulae TaxID=1639689 RepID=A0A2R8A7T4_9RHOB|nr:SDR family oxidoreductase [Pontivivens insulae]RED18391.1 gluconate 5-dehydrogenase [Pontivivens insulae]SPF28289.1 Gluconate 5-dehydrogenase [Pontivivens insulae]